MNKTITIALVFIFHLGLKAEFTAPYSEKNKSLQSHKNQSLEKCSTTSGGMNYLVFPIFLGFSAILPIDDRIYDHSNDFTWNRVVAGWALVDNRSVFSAEK